MSSCGLPVSPIHVPPKVKKNLSLSQMEISQHIGPYSGEARTN